MKASTAILIAVLVVIIALIIYAVAKDPAWANKGYWLANFVESPWKVYRRSDGTFDDAAQLALRRAAGRQNPTPADHLLSATIITRNIIEQEHRPEIDRRTGAPTRAAHERARLRRDMFDQARGHYMAALEGLRRQARPARPPRGDAPQEAPAARVVDAAFEFAFGGVAGLLANDPLLAAMVAEDWDFPAGIAVLQAGPAGIFIVDQPLATAAARSHEEVLRDRQRVAKEAAQEQGGAQGAAVNTYFDLATQETDDPQNAHDPGVVACLKAMVVRLRDDQKSSRLPTADEVIADLKTNGPRYSEERPALVADAVAVATKTKAGERYIAVDATDEECLCRIWARADDPRNAAVRSQLRQSLFDNLVDCWEDGISGRKIVCVTGRISRILSVLVLLDFDKRNWTMKKVEQFKNDIFTRAHELINETARRAAESDDPDMQKAGRLYMASTLTAMNAIGPVPEEASERLANEMRAAIDPMVDGYIAELDREVGLKGAIPAYLVDSVKKEAKAAIAS